MANTIDLKKLRSELRGTPITPENELPVPEPEPLLEPGTSFDADEGTLGVHGMRLIAWEALEFDHDVAASLNHLFFGSILIIAGVVTLFFRNFLFAIVLILGGAMTLSYPFRDPKQISHSVTSTGVQIGNRLYEFDSLKSFWIAYDPPFGKELILESHHTLMPHIIVPLGDLDPLRLREILLQFLREEKHEPSLIDIIGKRIGF